LEKPVSASFNLWDQKMHLLEMEPLSCRRHEAAATHMDTSSSDEDYDGSSSESEDDEASEARISDFSSHVETGDKMKKRSTGLEIMLEGYDSENELLSKPVAKICPTLGLAERKMAELII
jgi:hypothetical protein